jgi:hypothetical protein
MVTIRTRLPDDIAVPAAKVVADEIISILNEHGREVAGPALTMVFSFMLLEFGGHSEDMGKLSEVLRDVGELVTKYGAAIHRH